MVRCESRSSTIGHITLGTKQTGAPSAGNPHAGCDAAGAGNGFTVWLMRHSHRKRGETDRPDLRNTAPVLDPTLVHVGKGLPISLPFVRLKSLSGAVSTDVMDNVMCSSVYKGRARKYPSRGCGGPRS